jgi:hypothetical protein
MFEQIRKFYRKYILRKTVKIYIKWCGCVQSRTKPIDGFILKNPNREYPIHNEIIYDNSRMEKWKTK